VAEGVSQSNRRRSVPRAVGYITADPMATRPDHQAASWGQRRDTRGHLTHRIFGAHPATHKDRPPAGSRHRSTFTERGFVRKKKSTPFFLNILSNHCNVLCCLISVLFLIIVPRTITFDVITFEPRYQFPFFSRLSLFTFRVRILQSLSLITALHSRFFTFTITLELHYMREIDH